jgi:TPR repeat protein
MSGKVGRHVIGRSDAATLSCVRTADARISLGILYSMGQGVSRDYVIAWLSLVAGGDKKGAEARNNVNRRHMTPRQIAEAQKLAREWKPTSIPRPSGSAPMSKVLGQHASRQQGTT